MKLSFKQVEINTFDTEHLLNSFKNLVCIIWKPVNLFTVQTNRLVSV